MRTKFLTTVALATLLTVGGTAVALAQAADINFSRREAMNTTQVSSYSAPHHYTDGTVVASGGPSANHQPQS